MYIYIFLRSVIKVPFVNELSCIVDINAKPWATSLLGHISILKSAYLSKCLRFHRFHWVYDIVITIFRNISHFSGIFGHVLEFPQLFSLFLDVRGKVGFVGKRAKPCCGDKLSKLSSYYV